jgi:hypothetical protein
MYKSYLKDKRVVLVAPGSQTEIMKLGPLIDSYDIIARVGQWCPLVHDEVGSRTDIVMENFWFWEPKFKINLEPLYDEWVKQGVQWVNHVWVDNVGIDNFILMNERKNHIRIKTQEIEKIQGIRRELNSPTKGVCAIYDLVTYPIKELFIVGFSFCKGFSYRKDYFNNPFNLPPGDISYVKPVDSIENLNKWVVNLASYDHKVKEELEWFKNIKRDKRIKCDEWLERLCE